MMAEFRSLKDFPSSFDVLSKNFQYWEYVQINRETASWACGTAKPPQAIVASYKLSFCHQLKLSKDSGNDDRAM